MPTDADPNAANSEININEYELDRIMRKNQKTKTLMESIEKYPGPLGG